MLDYKHFQAWQVCKCLGSFRESSPAALLACEMHSGRYIELLQLHRTDFVFLFSSCIRPVIVVSENLVKLLSMLANFLTVVKHLAVLCILPFLIWHEMHFQAGFF